MSWPAPQSWIYSWVDTASPGYRRVRIAGAYITIADGYRRWPDYLAQIHGTVSAVNPSYYCTSNDRGGVRLYGASTIVWTDRLGWLLGMAAEPGDDAGGDIKWKLQLRQATGSPGVTVSWPGVVVFGNECGVSWVRPQPKTATLARV